MPASYSSSRSRRLKPTFTRMRPYSIFIASARLIVLSLIIVLNDAGGLVMLTPLGTWDGDPAAFRRVGGDGGGLPRCCGSSAP
ncbi:hypothetical protein D3C72_2062570 [compost metagenome]